MKNFYKWFLVAMLSFAFFFHQADRALFGLLTIPIQKELLLADVQIGWINTVLSWTMAVMMVVAGFIGDRFSRKWIITISLMFWSLMTICMGWANSFALFGIPVGTFAVVMFLRSIATGSGESFYAPSAYALIAEYHKESRSVAFSIHQAALYIGLMVSGVLVAWCLAYLDSWRNIFFVFGIAGFLLGVFFIFALKNPVGKELSAAASKSAVGAGLKAFFANPSALCASAGFVAIVFVNNAYLFWAPKFAAQKFLISVGSAGQGVMLYHHLCAFAAILLGGVITDRFTAKYPRFRLGFQIIALLGGAPMIYLLGAANAWQSFLICSAFYGIFRGCFEVNTHASLFDVIAPQYRSTAVGLLNFLGFFVGGFSGVLMGDLAQKFGTRGFEIGFGIMAGFYLAGALLMMISFFFTFRKNRVME
ncbi:MAG: MFS transporter [Victivallaceae bacterium]|nr:MFS transporter [Victivallaceae bacterium]